VLEEITKTRRGSDRAQRQVYLFKEEASSPAANRLVIEGILRDLYIDRQALTVDDPKTKCRQNRLTYDNSRYKALSTPKPLQSI
jgi:hypothetical protein